MSERATVWLREASAHVMRMEPRDVLWVAAGGELRKGASTRPGAFPSGMLSHPALEIAVATEGPGWLYTAEGRLRFEPPAVAIVQPGAAHCEAYGDGRRPYESLWLILHGGVAAVLVSRHTPRRGWSNPFRWTVEGASVRELSAGLTAAGEREWRAGGRLEAVRAELASILAELLRREAAGARPRRSGARAGGRHDGLLGQIVAFLDGNLDRPVTVEQVAAMARLTPRYLNRLFRERTGEAIHEYLTRRRMDQALALCRDTDLMVKEIAARVGYRDPLYFSRFFRARHGFSVSEMRVRGRMAP